jgi:hypothetical protein
MSYLPLHVKNSSQMAKMSCKVVDNVIGNGSNYGNAYWEIKYIRTYLSEDVVPPTSSVSGAAATPGAPSAVTTGSVSQLAPNSSSATFAQSSIFSWVLSLLLIISVIGLY